MCHGERVEVSDSTVWQHSKTQAALSSIAVEVQPNLHSHQGECSLIRQAWYQAGRRAGLYAAQVLGQSLVAAPAWAVAAP